ncbi:hypothetical protein Tco_1069347, partial [Tanacetum coccineum]
CNARIVFSKPQREETYQVTLDALKLSPCYPAFLITAEVPEVYMHQFWKTIKKIKDTDSYRFKLDKKKFRVDTEVFRENLQICPRLPNQDFVEPPSKEEMVSFIQELSYSGKCDMLSSIHTGLMHQPWRTFAAIINRCISGKSSGLDRLRLSRAQILWGMYNKKNVDFVSLLWEDFMFQADNREISSTRKENMPYPRFTKVIINHLISKDKTIFMRNQININTVRNDTLLGTLKFVFKTQDYQIYGALIPGEMINQDIKDSKAYKTYLDFATGKATPKKARKFKKVASPSKKLSPVLEEEPAKKPKRAKKPAKKSTTVPTAGVVIRDTHGESVSKKKTPTKGDRGKGMDLLSEAALLKAAQLKKTLKKSKLETHKLHASGSGDRVGSQPKVPDEQQDKTTGTDEGTGSKPGVPDVPKDHYESENESWGNSKDDDSNDDNSDDVSNDDDDDDVDSDAGGDNESVRGGAGKGDAEMTNVGRDDDTQQTTYEQVKDDEHVILTIVHDTEKTEVPLQSSFISSDFANQFLNLDNAPLVDNEVVSMMNVKVPAPTIPLIIPSITPLPQQSTPTPTPAPTNETTTTSIPALPDFSSMFGFNQIVSVLERDLSQLKQVDYSAQLLKTIKSQIPAMVDAQLSTRLKDSIQKAFRSYSAEFEKKAKDEKKRYIDLVEKSVKEIIKDENFVLAKSSSQLKSTYEAAASLIEFELKKILLDKMQKSKSYRAAHEHRDLYDALVKSYKLDKDLFESYGKAYSLKRDHEDNDKDEDPLAGSDQGLKKRKTSMDVEPSKGSKLKESKSSSSKGTKSQSKSSGKSAQVEESVFETTATEMPHNQESDLGNIDDQPNVETASKSDWFKKPKRPPTPDPDWNAKKLLILEHLRLGSAKFPKHKNLLSLLTTFNLLKGTCRSQVELEYHFEECYKVVTNRLDWNNSEGQEYPFDLSMPLPLIEDRGRQIVPVNYFINNYLEYLKGGRSSRKYTTSTTKTKAAKCEQLLLLLF